MKDTFFYTGFWMVPWRRSLDHPEIMRRLMHRVKSLLVSAELEQQTRTVAIWPSLVVDAELPRGIHSITRIRKPPAWRVMVVIPFKDLEAADARVGLQIMIEAWKLVLAECFKKVKLSPEESRRLIGEVSRIAEDADEILDV